MHHKLCLIILAAFALFLPLAAQDPGAKPEEKKEAAPDPKAAAAQIVAPTNEEEAANLFIRAWNAAREEKFGEATQCYNELLAFYRKDEKYKKFQMDVLNNISGILAKQGHFQASAKHVQEALALAIELKDTQSISEFYHKLGILYARLAKIENFRKVQENLITPSKQYSEIGGILFEDGNHLRLVDAGDEFLASRIQLGGARNPYLKKNPVYTKLVNLKLKSDFDPNEYLVPDAVDFLIQIRKKGYFRIGKHMSLLPDKEYVELSEIMMARERQIKAEITEDFYRRGPITPDGMTLQPFPDNKLTGKPIQISETESFKPGRYFLTIQKAGYQTFQEPLVIYPEEEPFLLNRQLQSKPRPVKARVRGDFPLEEEVTPDEITLNGQTVLANSEVKPAEYKLVIRKEGYEPVLKNVLVIPDERPQQLNEFMKVLPREVLFQLTGDYNEGEVLTPDEIKFNNKFIKYGESLRPDAYRVEIRKRGYESITEQVIIRPKNEPFPYNKKMISGMRRVNVKTLAHFPKGLVLNYANVSMNQKNAVDASFKPGKYTLEIKHSGYQPLSKAINMPPDDAPYELQEVLYPKPVAVEWEIEYDIEPDPEDKGIENKLVLTNEKSSEAFYLKGGDKIIPENYLLKVERAGYESQTSQEVILPSETPYKFKKRLSASPRQIVAQITAEYPPKEPVTPDQITLNDQAVTQGFKTKPGVYDLVILKEGYLPVREQLRILASPREFILSKELQTKTRLVTFAFRDSYDNRVLNPMEVKLGDSRIASDVAQTLKPGEYNLTASLTGYDSLNEKVLIPVGVEALKIEKHMKAIQRKVKVELTGDFQPEAKLVPDLVSLSEKLIAEEAMVKPGIYNLLIQKEGYYPIMEQVNINPGQDAYVIKKQMTSKPRQLTINIRSSFGDAKIVPDVLMVGSEKVKENQVVKPGSYALSIQKSGHAPLREQITVEPSEKPYLIQYTLDALPRIIQYEITNDYEPNKPCIPDVITAGDNIIDGKKTFSPGKYDIKITKQGFHSKKFSILLEPAEGPYTIQALLESMEREIELEITSEFPQGERVEPEVAALNGKDVRDNRFKPGEYKLDIQYSGFFPLQETIMIPPAERPFVVERELKVKPRVMQDKVAFDIPFPPEIKPHKIWFSYGEGAENFKEYKDGDKIKPGVYKMKIQKEAYETIEGKKYIWASETPYKVEEVMVAKQVKILINITYDVQAPEDLPDYKVSVIHEKTGFSQVVTPGKSIRPGTYLLDVQRPGYEFGPKKKIDIQPSEEPYAINEKLLAKPRRISFDMVDKRKDALVPAYQILMDGKLISFDNTFQPGTQFNLVVKFHKFKTVEKISKVVPGEGPFIEDVPLEPLKAYEINTRENEQEIDKIKYAYTFYEDGKPIEPHLVNMEKGVKRFIWTVYADPKAKTVQIMAGYMYAQEGFDRLEGKIIARLNNISVPKLSEHLDQVAKLDPARGYLASLIVIETMLRQFSIQKQLKSGNPKEIEQLMQSIEKWPVGQGEDGQRNRVRLQHVLEVLSKLK